MARGYLGKISAIVTVNTSDVAPKLSAGAKQFTSFARSTQSTISSAMSAAGKSFDQIFTPLQKLQRALAAANKDPLDLNIDTSKVEKLVLAANQLAKPLGESTKQFAALAGSVQRQFSPALEGVQAGMINLRSQIEAGTSIGSAQFRSLAADVEIVNGAIGRLKEQAALSAKLFTGQELTFVRPESIDSLNRLAAAQQKLAAAPAATRSSPIARDLLEDSQILSKQIENISARIERLRAQGLDITVSQAGLDLAVRRVNEVATLLDQITESPREVRIDVNAGDLSASATRLRGELDALRASADAALGGQNPQARNLTQEFDKLLVSVSGLDAAARTEVAPLVNEFLRLKAAAASATDQARALDDAVSAVGDIGRRQNPTGPQGPPVPPPFPGQGDRTDISNVGRSSNIAEKRTADARNELGAALDASSRQLDQFRSGIVSAKGQLDAMPAPIRTHFIPAIQAAEAEFIRLRALGPAATAEEIENATNNMRTLTAAAQRAQTAFNFEASFGGGSAQGAELNLQTRALQGYQAQLQILQQTLGRVGSEARGPALASFVALEQAIAEAFREGTLGSAATTARIETLTQAAVQNAAAVANVNAKGLGRDIKRAGDIGRGGADKLSLGFNQAAFAIDDFFSSTGGLEFKLRAISNNITQLGFVVGGTKGLFLGLGAVLAGQLAVGIVKFINNGRTAEDSTKALNDALARQKSLVEELAGAFDSLGDSIARGAFSAPAQDARSFEKELDRIAKKQGELRQSRVASLDPAVQRERGEQVKLRRQIDAESDGGRRVALQRQLDLSQSRERAAAQAAGSRRVSGEDVGAAIERAIQNFERSLLGGRTGPSRFVEEVKIDQRAAEARRAVPGGASAEDILGQRQALLDQIKALSAVGAQDNAFGFAPSTPQAVARAQQAELEVLLASLEDPLRAALDTLSNEIIRASSGVAASIESAQGDVADAILRGVKGAADFQAALDNTARQLDEAQQRLRDAQNQEDPVLRDQEVRRAQKEIADVRLRQDAINERSREVRLGRTFGGDRTTSALSALQGNERFANEYAGLTAQLAVAVDDELAARQQLQQAIRSGNESAQTEARQRLEAAQAAGDLAAATAEAALAMEQALTRLRKVGSDALSASEGLADDAQRRLTQDPTVGLDAGRRERDAAERQLISDRERVAKSQAAIDRARTEAGNDPAIARANAELESIRREREALAEDARINGTQADPRRMEELARREAELIAERERRLLALTEAERRQIDAIAYEIDARRRLADQIEKERQFDQEVANRRNPVGDPNRGLDLGESPAARAGRETAQGLADINAAYDEQLRAIFDRTNGLPNDATRTDAAKVEEDRRAAVNQFMEDQMRQLAPMTVGMADARQNALLQGPSRAALGATDVTTMQGQAELNRLLRGDDPNKNVDLVELQREANKLLEAIAKKENPVI